jgi:hypothetical protein
LSLDIPVSFHPLDLFQEDTYNTSRELQGAEGIEIDGTYYVDDGGISSIFPPPVILPPMTTIDQQQQHQNSIDDDTYCS